MFTSIIAIFAGILSDIPILDKWFQLVLSAYNAHKAARVAQGISTAQKDLDQAKTSDEIRKAADEEAKALRDSL